VAHRRRPAPAPPALGQLQAQRRDLATEAGALYALRLKRHETRLAHGAQVIHQCIAALEPLRKRILAQRELTPHALHLGAVHLAAPQLLLQ
jgi:hypothetical protein